MLENSSFINVLIIDIPALKKFRFPLFIDEGEPSIHLAVRTQAPNLVQLELWIHRFRDIDSHFKQKGVNGLKKGYFLERNKPINDTFYRLRSRSN